MIKLTDMEKQALDAITKDDFYEDDLNSVIWVDVYLDTLKGYYGIKSTVARGVLSSLIQKGIIRPIQHGRDGAIKFTEYGKEIMRELGY